MIGANNCASECRKVAKAALRLAVVSRPHKRDANQGQSFLLHVPKTGTVFIFLRIVIFSHFCCFTCGIYSYVLYIFMCYA